MPTTSPIILFDGQCIFCNRMVNFIIRHNSKKTFRFCAIQSSKGKDLLEQYGEHEVLPDSLFLIRNNNLYAQSTAVIQICSSLDFPVRALATFGIIPRFIRDQLYRFVAARRYHWFGKKEACMIPEPSFKERFIL